MKGSILQISRLECEALFRKEPSLTVSDPFLLGLDPYCPFRLVVKIQGCEAVKFGCLRNISFHKPGFRHVIVVLAVCGTKGNRSFKNPEGLFRLVLLDEKASLAREL